MKHLVAICLLIVISNPYEGLDYDNINSYEIENNLRKVTITVHCAEGHNDCNSDYEESSYYEETKVSNDDYYMNPYSPFYIFR